MTRSAIAQLLADTTTQLAAAGVASPRHDAEVLTAHVLGVPRTRLPLLDAAAIAAIEPALWSAIDRRARREPLQHVVGSTGFRHLDLAVGPGVLIPRPETELLVDAALQWLHAEGVRAPRAVDLGTGSGAIALALADECPAATVWAVERDAAALRWAALNVTRTGLPVRLVDGDMATALAELHGTVDLVVSNPPYLPLAMAPDLEPEVADYDPAPRCSPAPTRWPAYAAPRTPPAGCCDQAASPSSSTVMIRAWTRSAASAPAGVTSRTTSTWPAGPDT